MAEGEDPARLDWRAILRQENATADRDRRELEDERCASDGHGSRAVAGGLVSS